MPAPTFAQIQSVLYRRAGPLAALADPNEATFLALSWCGYSPADPAHVIDADLATFPMADFGKLADIAEWRMLEAMARNATPGELKRIGVVEDVEKVAAAIRLAAERKLSFVRQAYGVGLPTLNAGVLTLNAGATFDPANPYPYAGP